MVQRNIRGSFASGGITGAIVDMFHAGLFRALFDVQCFDLHAVDSYRHDEAHLSMSASMYASPHNRGAVVNQLDAMILGAAEIDVDFNVNVTTGTDGIIMGGSGGHADAAAGAKLAIVTTRLNAGGYAKIVDRVTTVTTPGETIDVVVTEAGVAVHPEREELRERLVGGGVSVVPIEQLRDIARRGATQPAPAARGERIVAVVEYRDGTVTDVVHAVI
jgi:citrate lyase subunit alpha / citrate CoA-transferase